MQKTVITVLIVILSAVLLLNCGCAHFSKGLLLKENSKSTITFVPDELQCGNDKKFSDSINIPAHIGDNALPEIQSLISSANNACTQGQFFEANVAISEALNMISVNQSKLGAVDSMIDSLYSQIVSIYMLLPPEFIETVPEEIASIVFQKCLVKAMDSLVVSEADSISLSRMLGQKGMKYDLPMVWNSRVLRALVYFSRGRKGPVATWLDRSSRYVPVMQPLFAEAGIPQDLVYLPLIESGFSSKAYSYAHASGIWQFIPGTGKRFGLRINYWIDERRDPKKATIAAIRYLKILHQEFGDWHLALAAYNCGEGNVRRAIAKNGTNDFWKLALPKETMNYVPQFLAALIVAKNPRAFGFVPSPQAPSMFDTVFVSSCVDMKLIADGLGIPLDTFQSDNLHIMRFCTPPDMQDVALCIPEGSKASFDSLMGAIPPENKVRWLEYKVRRNETLSSIAKKFNVSIDGIRSLNGGSSKKLIAGRSVLIPQRWVEGAVASFATNKDTSSFQDPEVKSTWVVKNKSISSITYTVRSAETLSHIALLFKTSVKAIETLNGFSARDRIKAGQEILVPGKGVSGATAETVNRSFAPEVSSKKENFIRYKIADNDNLSSLAETFETTVSAICILNGFDASKVLYAGDVIRMPATETKAQSSESSKIVYYTIRSGDNLWSIAQTFKVPVESLYQANGLKKDSILIPGNSLKIVASVEMYE